MTLQASGDVLQQADQVVRALDALAIADLRPLQVAAAEVGGEPVDLATARGLSYAPVQVGHRWGRPWDTVWFRLRADLPDRWAGRTVVVRVDLGGDLSGGEGLLYRDGVPVRGLAPYHTEYVWTEAAVPGDRLDLLAEAAANPSAWLREHEPLPGGVALDREPLWTLAAAEVGVLRPDVRALGLDVAVLVDLARALPEDERGPALDGLAQVLAALDLDRLTETLPAARERAVAARRPGAPDRHLAVAVGNSHIDTAWLWPLRETHRKIARTTASLLDLMDRDSDYTFAISQPAQLAWLRDEQPALFARLAERVREGRVEPVGAMWVEPDCNLPSGESLLRQVLHGQRFWRTHFGVEAGEVWQPDVFGYPASLPGLMRTAGIRRFMTQKMSWNEVNRFPRTTFWWEGVDGSRVLSHLPPADTYNAYAFAEELRRSADKSAGHASTTSLYLYGFGDGGGGPTQRMLERLRRYADVAGLPRVRFGTVAQFWAEVERTAADAPDWVGELYLEKHRGTLTTQARIKAGNRRLEGLLREVELWAACGPAEHYPAAELDAAWAELLVHQFHDMLPGSSIAWVHRETEQVYDRLERVLSALRDAALHRLAGPGDRALVANASPHDRVEVVEVDGAPHVVRVPALSAVVLADAAVDVPAADVRAVEVGEREMSNGLLRVRWDDAGLVTSLVDLVRDREVVPPGRRLGVLQLLEDRPADWDAWDVDAATMTTARDVDTAEAVEVVEAGPLRAVVQVRRRAGASTFVQRLVLAAGSPRLDLVTRVDWHERHTLLKLAVPVDVVSSTLTAEVQYAAVERPTHRNTSWDAARFEVCGQRWVDRAEAGFGVAVLNDGRYGHDVVDGAVRVSLLRSPTWPDPEADQGEHEVTVSVLPHGGDRTTVMAQAWALNTPLRAFRGAGPVTPVVVSDDPGVEVVVVKRGEPDGAAAGDVVVRLVETTGGRRRATVSTTLPVRAVQRLDAVERPLGDPEPVTDATLGVELRPYEIRTVRLVL